MKIKFFKNKLTVAIVLLSVTFLILISQSIKRENVSLVENGIGYSFNSIQGVFYNLGSNIKYSLGFIFNYSTVKSENEQLAKRNDELENKLVEYDSIKSENDRLRSMVNFKDSNSSYSYIGCDIIGKSGSGYLDQFIINKGTNDGIAKNMIAVTGEGLVGQVTSVSSNWALVQSLSNENLAVSAMVESTNENSGILKGYKSTGSTLLTKLYYLPADSNVAEGDVILTSGLGGLYPKGIRIGKVLNVEEDKGKVMKTALVQPYVDFNKIQELFIVVPQNKIDITY